MINEIIYSFSVFICLSSGLICLILCLYFKRSVLVCLLSLVIIILPDMNKESRCKLFNFQKYYHTCIIVVSLNHICSFFRHVICFFVCDWFNWFWSFCFWTLILIKFKYTYQLVYLHGFVFSKNIWFLSKLTLCLPLF